MDKCMGCLGFAFGTRRRRNRLRYRVNYGNNNTGGIEFDNLILDEDDEKQMNYGTTHHFVSHEEKEIIAKREYDKILDQQRKIDEQISKKTFEEEERLRVEEERFREAQQEASRAVSAALKVQQFSRGSLKTRNVPENSLYSLEDSDESDDDFESFLESVKTRSDLFRNNKSDYCKNIAPGASDNNNTKVVSTQPRALTVTTTEERQLPDFADSSRDADGIADGMSSDGSFSYDNQTVEVALDDPEMEWDKFVDGLETEKQQAEENSEQTVTQEAS